MAPGISSASGIDEIILPGVCWLWWSRLVRRLSHSVSAVGQIMECALCLHFSSNASALAEGDGIRQIPRQIRLKNPATYAITFCTHAPLSSHYWTVSLPLILPLAVCHAEEKLRGGQRKGGAEGQDARGNAEAQIKP